jgi:GT2 family glycosyltransferase
MNEEQGQVAEPLRLLVTAVVVCRNAHAALRRCLTALDASQGRDRIEIVVVDNGSTDGTVGLEAEFPEVRFLKLPRNFGYTKAASIGIRSANAEYVFLTVPEVEVAPATLLELATRLEAMPAYAAVCPLLVNESGEPRPEAGMLPSQSHLRRAAASGGVCEPSSLDLSAEWTDVECAGRSAVLYRRYFLKGIRLDERYGEFWFDVELAVQVWKASKKIALLPQVKVAKHATAEEGAEELTTPRRRALLAADSIHGAGTLLAKHFGAFAGFRFKVGVMPRSFGSALLSTVTFNDPGYHWRLFSLLLGGQKIDGSQGEY